MAFKDQGLKNTLVPMYIEMHQDGHFPGVCVLAYADKIADIIEENPTQSILDYGCQPHDAAVLTPYGWKPIGEITPGEYVIGASGRPVLVTGLHSPGRVEVFRIFFNDGTSLVVDGNHLWTVRTSNHQKRQQPFIVRRTVDLAGESLHWRNPNWGYEPLKWRIPMVAPVEFGQERELPLDPYLMGVLLGDGSFRTNNVQFTSADQAVVEHVMKVLPPEVELVESPKEDNASCDYRIVRSDRAGCRWVRNPVKEAVEKLGLDAVPGWEKFVPSQYLYASAKDRVSLLAGLLDTDGEVREKHISYCSVSRQLANDVVFVAQSLGCNASISVRDRQDYRIAYIVHIKPAKGLVLTRAKPWFARREYHANRMIAGIEPAGKMDVIGISVASLDQLYVTENFIVTHNCGKGHQYMYHKIHERWGVPQPALYDPAAPGHRFLPPGPFDGVICTDVLEHIPELDLDRHIGYIVQRARKWAFISVCCRPSECFLPNGVNEHVTLRPPSWWEEKLGAAFHGKPPVLYLEFSE